MSVIVHIMLRTFLRLFHSSLGAWLASQFGFLLLLLFLLILHLIEELGLLGNYSITILLITFSNDMRQRLVALGNQMATGATDHLLWLACYIYYRA